MPRLICAADQLRRAVCAGLGDFAGSVTVERIVSRRWASITFGGERHEILLSIAGLGAGAAADAFTEGLTEREFDLRGHILADIALLSDVREDEEHARLTLEALTVEAN